MLEGNWVELGVHRAEIERVKTRMERAYVGLNGCDSWRRCIANMMRADGFRPIGGWNHIQTCLFRNGTHSKSVGLAWLQRRSDHKAVALLPLNKNDNSKETVNHKNWMVANNLKEPTRRSNLNSKRELDEILPSHSTALS